MSQYQTKQRKTLVDYWAMHPDETLSAKKIAVDLEAEGISLSAVYRNLTALEADGKIRRCATGEGREAQYRYADADGCKDWLHMACIHCGRTFHLAKESTDLLMEQIAKSQFTLDKKSTILYGACHSCQEGL